MGIDSLSWQRLLYPVFKTRFFFRVILTTGLLLVFSVDISAQKSAVKAFCELSHPEKRWVFFHPFVAKRAWRITTEIRDLVALPALDSLLDGDRNGGQIDAFRHCYWQARLSQEMRWRKALRLGEAHEKANYLSYKKKKYEDGVVPDSVSSAMDRFNNRLGAKLGCENRAMTPADLQKLVIQYIKSGKAMKILKNSHGEYIDCQGKVLSPDTVRLEWNSPKCLVPSDR